MPELLWNIAYVVIGLFVGCVMPTGDEDRTIGHVIMFGFAWPVTLAVFGLVAILRVRL